MKQNEMIILEWLFQEKKIKKTYNPKPLRQIARDNIRLDVRQLNKELARKMKNPYYFTDRNLRAGYKINLDSHNLHHTNSKLTILPIYPEFGIEFR